ncbi:MAG: SpoIIE family protein phosphatase [Spirochaetia bacterium]|nr:SpoIIE family protein phosphatase [Spirochaetia bacterium]
MPPIRFEYFGCSFAIAGVFQLYAGLIAFGVKERSKSTQFLGLFFFSSFFFCVAYAVASSIHAPCGAFHRWVTVFVASMNGILLSQVMIHFPSSRPSKKADALLWISVAVNVVVTGYFMLQTLHAPRVYLFSARLWDFDVDILSRNIGLYILINSVVYVVVGIYRIIREKPVRAMLSFLLAAGLLLTFIPGILNVMSRDGAMSRELYVTLFTILGVSGCFIIIVIFLNNTEDKTSFMGKITGISLVAILGVLLLIGYFFLGDAERSFDQFRNKDVSMSLVSGQPAPGEAYRLVWDSKKAEHSGATLFDVTPVVEQEYANALIVSRIASLPDDSSFPGRLAHILEQSHQGFAGHRRALSRTTSLNQAAVLEQFSREEGLLFHRSTKIRGIPAAGFRPLLAAFLEKSDPQFEPYREAMQDVILTDKSDGEALKTRILCLLVPAAPPGTRHYRQGAEPGLQFVSYIGVIGDKVVEIGFPYDLYRLHVHRSAVKLMTVLAGAACFVIFGYRLFFAGALLTPLRNLLSGVGRVNGGDFSVRIEPRVEDEIGFLTRSFNDMVISIGDARARLQDYAANLEARVKERTAELQSTLTEVQALKTQQDGDYFLTSILLKPLGMNRVKSDVLTVDFLLRQKKRFKFRHWDGDIGGDMCIADNITLSGKQFTVFLNGDAMGKSMQGAGGALVLGSVFEAILARTRSANAAADHFPERWLKNAFIELHKVFEAFDGSMLVSLAMGLIDEETGFMYYINAEHPWTMLYRDGRAQFLENELYFRKLGMPRAQGRIFVQTFQLLPGDIVIAGSDGRDDIQTHANGENAVINEDENRILFHV